MYIHGNLLNSPVNKLTQGVTVGATSYPLRSVVKMPFWSKFHCLLLRYQILKDCTHFLGDASKYVVALSKLFFIAGNLWVKSFSKTRRVVFYLMVTISIVHQINIFVYCCSYVRDVDTLSEVLPALSLTLQVRIDNLLCLFEK